MEKSYPIKQAINNMLVKKCSNCNDKTFCKLQTYYKNIEKPTIKDLENLTKCLYYKKNLLSRKMPKYIA